MILDLTLSVLCVIMIYVFIIILFKMWDNEQL